MKNLIICIAIAALAAISSPARADDPGTPDWTGKSWADYYTEFAGCDPSKEQEPGTRCAPVAAARAGLEAIDSICDDYDEDGACISTDEAEEAYRDCNASSPMAAHCWRASGRCSLSGGSATERSLFRFCGSSGTDGWRKCCYLDASVTSWTIICTWNRGSEINDVPGHWPRPNW